MSETRTFRPTAGAALALVLAAIVVIVPALRSFIPDPLLTKP
jgi:hypothetical protein